MKRGDMVRVMSGQHVGQTGRIIRIMGGWVDFVRADNRGVQVRAGECECLSHRQDVQPDAGPDAFAREHIQKWPE